jgi:tetratricopeptide (TPR) repeat protein
MTRICVAIATAILATSGGSLIAQRPAPASALAGPVQPAIAQPAAGRILVVPFETLPHEGRYVWLGEAASVLLADDLNALGAPAITRDERREAFDRLQVPPAATLSDATVIRIGQLVRASRVVLGTLRIEGDSVVVHARSIALEAAKVQADVTERGTLAELFATFERTARRIAPPRPPADPGPELPRPPVGAFENYIKGLLAETPATSIGYLQAALKADPTLDRARIALWQVFDDQGDHAQALAAVNAVRPNSPLARRAAFRVALSQMNLKRYDDAFATLKALADARPSPAIWNNIGVLQLRRGSTVETGLPAYWFNKAAEADATDPDYFFNLAYAYWLQRDGQAAVYWARETLRRNPADGDAHYLLGTALAAVGSGNESLREKELARRLSSAYADWDRRPASDPIPRGLERLKSDVELPHSRQIEDALANSQRDQQELARFYLERARRLTQQENDRDAMDDLNRVLFLSPYDPEAHLLLGRIHLRAGHAHEAIDAFKISIWSADTAEAHALLAEAYLDSKDTEQARREAERALAMNPALESARRLLARLPQ